MNSQPRPRSFLSRAGKSIFSILNAKGRAHEVSTSPLKREASPLNPNRQKRRKTISFAPVDGSLPEATPTVSPFTSEISPRGHQVGEDEGLALWLSQYLFHKVHGEKSSLASEDDLLERTKCMLFPVLRCLKPTSEVIFFALHLLGRAFPKPIPEADVRFLDDAAIIMVRLFLLFLRLSSAWLEEIGVLRDEIRTAHLVYWMHLDKVLVHRSLIQSLHILDHDLTISQVTWSLQLHQFRGHIERYMQPYHHELFNGVLNLVIDLEQRYLKPSSSFREQVNMHSQLLQDKQRARVMEFLMTNLPKHRCDLSCSNWPTVYPLEPVDPETLVVIPSSLSTASIISVYDIPDDEALYDLKKLEKTMSELMRADSELSPAVAAGGFVMTTHLPAPHIDGLPRELSSVRQRFPFQDNSRSSSELPVGQPSSKGTPSQPPGSPTTVSTLDPPGPRSDDLKPTGAHPSRWLSPATIAQLGHRPLRLSFITGRRTPGVLSPVSPSEE